LSDHARFLPIIREVGESEGTRRAEICCWRKGLTRSREEIESGGNTANVSPRISPAQAQRRSLGRSLADWRFRRSAISTPREKPDARSGKRTNDAPGTGRLFYHLDRRRRAEIRRCPGDWILPSILQRYPASPLFSDVRMKLGGNLLPAAGFPNAQTQFQLMRRRIRAPVSREALFIPAAKSRCKAWAPSARRALVLLDEVSREWRTQWAARNEQALIERKLGKPQDATTLYDEVLQGPRPEEKREALCGKGDILYVGTGRSRKLPARHRSLRQLASQKERRPALAQSGALQESVCSRIG